MDILIDLDQTIIDSRIAGLYRKSRNWPEVYKSIPSFKPYPGILELLVEASSAGSKICIVTSSPETYCKKVILYWNISFDATVCYHDTISKKPFPEPILLGISRINSTKSNAIMIGDSDKDILAGKAAGVKTIAACWGSEDRKLLDASNPDFHCESVDELRAFILIH